MNALAGMMISRHEMAPGGIHVHPKQDESRTMKTLQWFGSKDVRVEDAPVPMVTDPGDVVIKVTSTAICGSDLVRIGLKQ